MNLNLEKSDGILVKRNPILSRIAGWFSVKSRLRSDTETGIQDDLKESIRQAKLEWVTANANFEQAVDTSMVDYYTYKIKACEVRYQYLLKEAKEKGVKTNQL